jgi:hypothetical protein
MEEQKAMVMRMCIPSTMKIELEAHEMVGGTFAQWMIHLEAQYGNTEEMEKKRWKDMRIQHRGKLRSPEWRSFMAQFMAGLSSLEQLGMRLS